MAAIVGIVASLVGPVIEIGKYVVSPIKRHFTYLCCFDSNIQSLRGEARNLENKRDGLQREVDAAENNAEVIVPEVTTWLENVRNKIQVDKSGIDDEIPTVKNGCWGIKSRYRLSREAVKITGEMKQLVEDRNKFNHISSPPPPAAHVPIPLGKTYEFQSRKQIEEEIMEALRAKEVRTMGICGMGGVGKTTMAKKIMNKVKDENILEEIFMVVVSQQVDMLKIQDEIAESLGLRLEEKTLAARANKLRARLTGANTKRILIVLDDVWEKLKFDNLGIPCGNERCTILLTSRNRDVLNKMDVQKICAMKILSKTEAWFLFREKAGTCADDQNLCSTAESVAEECKGLPIALITVGGALKDQTTITFWEDALQQLKSFNPADMPDVIKDVYNPLKLSYTYLESRHAKSLFLLCSLFPEDVDINLEDLALYCMALRMFCNLDFSNTSEGTLEKVRKRVLTIVHMLKNRFLLLEGFDEGHVRMHDVVRDVAIYIASNEAKEGIVDVKFNSMRSSREYTYEWVSVFSEKTSSLLRMHASDRENRFEIKDFSLFEEMTELNVLSFKYISLKSLEIQLLKNLRTLCLESCELESLSVVGELLSLESLYCSRCSGIVELPVEIGKLNQLKLLDFSNCRNLRTIPPGVVSNLVELEEFKMLWSFSGWELAAEVQGQERRNASLNEFENLSKLTCFEIEINDFNLAAEEIRFSPNIVKYNIQIGGVMGSLGERGMLMNLRREIKLGSWVLRFLRSSNCLYLKGDGSNSLDLPHSLDLPQAHSMKSLKFENWSTVKRLVNPTTSIDDWSKFDVFPILESLKLLNLPNLEEIFDGQVLDQSNSFKNLEELYLEDMPALKHLCKRPNRNVSLDNLQWIKIRKCNNLLNLFSFTMANDLQLDRQNPNASIGINQISTSRHVDDLLCTQKAHFPMLQYLALSELDKLEVIWNAPIPEGSNSFKNLRELRLSYLPAMTHLWKSPSRNVSLGNLSEIHIEECHKLCSLFSSMSMDFVLQLKRLEIKSCKMMEQVFLNEENENDINQRRTIQFPKLSVLTLRSLENLTAFSKGIECIEFPMLMSLLSSTGNNQNSAEGLDNDTFHLFCNEKAHFPMLEILELSELDKLEVIWNAPIPEGSNSFKNLRKLRLSYLPAMTHLWKSPSRNVSLSNLSKIYIEQCHKLCSLFLSMPMDFVLQLERLRIKSCKMMEQVFLNEENENDINKCRTIQFPKLSVLTLCSLESLTAFSKGVKSIEFPMLVNMNITDCPKLMSLLSSTGNNQNSAEGLVNDTFHLFCSEKAHFPMLEILELSELDKLEVIWNDPIPEGSNSFKNLRTLILLSLPAMTHLWKSPSQNVSLSNLSEIHIVDFVLQLERLEIKSCKKMEQVFLNGENENDTNQCCTIKFPKLYNLTLRSLESLTAFSKGIESIEFPMLVNMNVRDCPKLMSLLSSTGNNQNSAEGLDNDTIHLFCSEKAHFPMLTNLWLEELDKLEVIWNAPIPEGSNSFKNLRTLMLLSLPAMTHLWKSPSQNVSLSNLSKIYIDGCHKLHSLFSSTMSMDFGLQLEGLEINHCKMMEQVFLNEENENDTNQCCTIQFPKLYNLTLRSLESLTAFSKGIESIEFPMLVNMNVRDCPKLMSLLSSTGNNQNSAEGLDNDTFHLFCSEKVSFGSLKRISIGIDDKSNIWCHQIPLGFFSQLEELEITYCNNIRSLFSSLIAENLVSLKNLTISNCNEMAKVIEDDEEMLCEKPIILFPSLKKLQFWCLLKLESFCNWRCDLQLPLLEYVNIRSCPLLGFFTMGSVSTPNMKRINQNHGILGDLNSEIQLRFKAEHQLRSTAKESTSTEASKVEADQEKSEIERGRN